MSLFEKTQRGFKYINQGITFETDRGPITRAVEVDVFYRKGGLSTRMFSYQPEERGIYVSIGEVQVEKKETYAVRTVTAFSHPTYFVKGLKAKAPKQIEAFMLFLQPNVEKIGQVYQNNPIDGKLLLYEQVCAFTAAQNE